MFMHVALAIFTTVVFMEARHVVTKRMHSCLLADMSSPKACILLVINRHVVAKLMYCYLLTDM